MPTPHARPHSHTQFVLSELKRANAELDTGSVEERELFSSVLSPCTFASPSDTDTDTHAGTDTSAVAAPGVSAPLACARPWLILSPLHTSSKIG